MSSQPNTPPKRSNLPRASSEQRLPTPWPADGPPSQPGTSGPSLHDDASEHRSAVASIPHSPARRAPGPGAKIARSVTLSANELAAQRAASAKEDAEGGADERLKEVEDGEGGLGRADEDGSAPRRESVNTRKRKQEARENERLAGLTATERRKAWIVKMVESSAVQTITTATTIFALFGPDFKFAFFRVDADIVFLVLTIIAFVIFKAELVSQSWAKPGFLWSFFFWLDALATYSLIFDMPFIMEPLILSLASGSGDEAEAAGGQTTAARAGRAARAGARAGRIVRVVRLARLAQLMKKILGSKSAAAEKEGKGGSHAASEHTPSQTGKILSDKLTQYTIIGCLAFMIGFSLIYRDQQFTGDDFRLESLRAIELAVAAGAGPGALHVMYDELRNFHHCIELHIPGSPVTFATDVAAYEVLRPGDELVSLGYTTAAGLLIEAVFDVSGDTSQAAALNIALTCVLIVLLGLMTYMFSSTANRYCIQPIESIMDMMREFSKNPLAKMVSDEDEEAEAETSQLKESISKIGDLLRIGFGEAGGRIIGENLNSRGGDLDVQVPGKRMHAIFGFVVVFEFGTLTECLKETIMLFVNHIAGVVHKCVHGHRGSCNKNIGEAWLVVWPLKSENDYGEFICRGGEIEELTHGRGHTIADCALSAFILSPLLVRRNHHLNQLEQHQAVQRAIPNYRVNMGYGLHKGWAIEGAIGSDLKIDASYLSPNVNLASRLEAASKQYHVNVLFSQEIYDILSPARAMLCRKLDVVTVKGSAKPMTLYTFDVAEDEANLDAATELTSRWIDTQKHWKTGKPPGGDDADTVMDENVDHRLKYLDRVDAAVEAVFRLRRTTTPEFEGLYARALDAYLLGDWKTAARLFRQGLQVKPADGPTETLLAYIERRELKAPQSWRGVRELTSK